MEKLDQEKAVMFLHSHMGNQIVPEMPLKAIVTPRVTDTDDTSITPGERWAIQRAMSFTTMSQLPCVGHHTNDFISKLSSTLPIYSLELGRDLKKIPVAVSDFLADLPYHQSFPFSLPVSRSFDNSRTKPLVTVIIPVYNGERFINDAVDNVLSQNYNPLEIIIGDDGSTDRTEEIVNQISFGIRYFKQETVGPSSARNRGIRDASGDFIVFLDVDDLWPENNLNLLVDEMLNGADIEVIRGYAPLMEYNAGTGEYDLAGNPKEAFPNYIGAAIYRKSAFRKVGLFDPTLMFGEDTDWFNRAYELKLKVKRLEDVTLMVRRHGNNMTHGKGLVELNTLKVFKKCIDRKRARDQDAQNSQQLLDK
jgi:hypothetical protein